MGWRGAPLLRRVLPGLVVAASGLVVLASGAMRAAWTGGAAEGASAAAPLGGPPPLPGGAAAREAAAALGDARGEGCSFPDAGFGRYAPWRALPAMRVASHAAGRPKAQVLVPQGGGLAEDGAFDLLVHFHGAEPVRKLLATAGLPLTIAAVDAGTRSSHYDRALPDPQAFDELVRSVEGAVGLASGRLEAYARRVFVSSWSAGYGAVANLLRAPHERLDSVVLLDSLHAGYAHGGRLERGQLADFVKAARAAQGGDGPLRTFFLTHTEITPPDYASTTETSRFLLGELGARELSVDPSPEDPMRLTSLYEGGGLFVRGYEGKAQGDHCAQLRLLPGILEQHVLPALQGGADGGI